ncbi:hypothetical protein TSMEX_004486 [Taenia solium]|eukprot:TsM_000492500 transcript=TsM_000492500 gene=TsM_000492500
MVGPVGRHLTTQDECASITRQITRNVYIKTCRKIMQPRVFHPPNFFLPFLLLLCSEPHHCQSEQSRWGIESDINRLLSSDDATLYHREEIEQSSFNGTVFTNSTSGENFTSYWHLPADAPLLEQPGADTSQSPVPIKHNRDFRLKAGPSLRSCTRLQVLPLRPLYEFIAFVCVPLTGYNKRLTLASAITTRNSYIPGEIVRGSEGCIRPTQTDSKLSPRELLEIPKFTRTQFFDTLSELPEREQTDQCITSKAVQIIAVYEPIYEFHFLIILRAMFGVIIKMEWSNLQ